MALLKISSFARARIDRDPMTLRVSQAAARGLLELVGPRGRCDCTMLPALLRLRLQAADDHELTQLIVALMRDGEIRLAFEEIGHPDLVEPGRRAVEATSDSSGRVPAAAVAVDVTGG